MKGYLSYFKQELLTGLQYREAAIAGCATQFFWGLLYCMIYLAFYSHTSIDSMSFKEIISYVWLNQGFIYLVALSIKDNDIAGSIKEGTVAYELLRPYDLYYWWFIKMLSKKYSAAFLRCIPIFMVSFILPKPFNLSLPISLQAFVLFLITLFLGSIIVSSIVVIIHFICFFTLSDKGIFSLIATIGQLLSGMDVPLPLLPTLIITISEFLPFRLVGDLPFRIYSGNISGDYAIRCIIFQVIWIVLLTIIGKLIMKKALTKVCIQGG